MKNIILITLLLCFPSYCLYSDVYAYNQGYNDWQDQSHAYADYTQSSNVNGQANENNPSGVEIIVPVSTLQIDMTNSDKKARFQFNSNYSNKEDQRDQLSALSLQERELINRHRAENRDREILAEFSPEERQLIHQHRTQQRTALEGLSPQEKEMINRHRVTQRDGFSGLSSQEKDIINRHRATQRDALAHLAPQEKEIIQRYRLEQKQREALANLSPQERELISYHRNEQRRQEALANLPSYERELINRHRAEQKQREALANLSPEERAVIVQHRYDQRQRETLANLSSQEKEIIQHYPTQREFSYVPTQEQEKSRVNNEKSAVDVPKQSPAVPQENVNQQPSVNKSESIEQETKTHIVPQVSVSQEQETSATPMANLETMEQQYTEQQAASEQHLQLDQQMMQQVPQIEYSSYENNQHQYEQVPSLPSSCSACDSQENPNEEIYCCNSCSTENCYAKSTPMDSIYSAFSPECCCEYKNDSWDLWIYPNSAYLGYTVGRGIGYNRGYTTLGLFSAPSVFSTSRFQSFVDLQANCFNNGKWATSLGGGIRYFLTSKNIILGVNTYYDYRRVHHFDFNQMGVGIEVLSPDYDIRVNGYIPVGSRNFHRVKGYDLGDGYFASYHKHASAWYGVDAEIGTWIKKKYFCDWLGVYLAAGPYYYWRDHHRHYFDHGHQHAAGARIRLLARLCDFVDMSLIATYDQIWHTRVQGQIALAIPFDCFETLFCSKKNGCECECLSSPCLLNQIATQPVYRNRIIVADQKCNWKWNWSECNCIESDPCYSTCSSISEPCCYSDSLSSDCSYSGSSSQCF